jgi:hypothetical protein
MSDFAGSGLALSNLALSDNVACWAAWARAGSVTGASNIAAANSDVMATDAWAANILAKDVLGRKDRLERINANS